MKTNIKEFLKTNEFNKELINFIDNNNITDKLINDNFYLFEDYVNSFNLCKKRESLDKCQQEIKGYRLKLTLLANQKIKLVLTDCLHRINSLDQKEANNKFLIRHYDDELLSLMWSKHFNSTGIEREKILVYLKDLLKNKNYPGLYLHGNTNVGKTFIFILLANKLIAKKETVCFIVWPQFVSEIKKSFKNDNDNYSSKIELIKTCQYLFIDDLGSESISSWERDELLFPILNSRVLPLKTTFINSNYNFKDLAKCYRLQSNKIEETKVNRLIERIKKLTYPIELTSTFKELIELEELKTNKNFTTSIVDETLPEENGK